MVQNGKMLVLSALKKVCACDRKQRYELVKNLEQ